MARTRQQAVGLPISGTAACATENLYRESCASFSLHSRVLEVFNARPFANQRHCRLHHGIAPRLPPPTLLVPVHCHRHGIAHPKLLHGRQKVLDGANGGAAHCRDDVAELDVAQRIGANAPLNGILFEMMLVGLPVICLL